MVMCYMDKNLCEVTTAEFIFSLVKKVKGNLFAALD